MTTHNAHTHSERWRIGRERAQAKCQCQCQGNQENLLQQMARQIREESQVFARADDDDVDGVANTHAYTHTRTHTHAACTQQATKQTISM